MTEEMRQLCRDAGMPEGDIIRVANAVILFNHPGTREHVLRTLIDVWKNDRGPRGGQRAAA